MGSIINQTYRRDVELPILAPLDQRQGQLVEGALAAVGSSLDLGNVSNVIQLREGDRFYFISVESELTDNPDAEVVLGNTEVFLIEDITDTVVSFDHAWVAEPNTAGKFYEFKVLRKIPQIPFTFERLDQLDFSAAGVVLTQNGVIEVTTNTNPDGEDTLVEWPDGSLLFEPLGQSRYRCTPTITVDANIEVVIPDLSPPLRIELRLSNLALFVDTPMWAIGDDNTQYNAWVKGRLLIYERILGLEYIQGQKGVDVKIVASNPQAQQVQAGSQADLLVNLVIGSANDPYQIDGATIYFQSREQVCGTEGPVILAQNVSPGLVRVLIPAAQLQPGVLVCQMVIFPSAVDGDIIRTNTFILNVLA